VFNSRCTNPNKIGYTECKAHWTTCYAYVS
jgi:hypothetical protein